MLAEFLAPTWSRPIPSPSAPPSPTPPLPAPPTLPCTHENKCATAPRAAPAAFLLSAAPADAPGLLGLLTAFRQSAPAAYSSPRPWPQKRGPGFRCRATTRAAWAATGQSCSSLAGAASDPLPVP